MVYPPFMRRRLLTTLTATALVLLSTSFAPREAEADPILDVGKGDVGVQADKLEIDVAAGSAVLTGKVVLSKGDMTVQCPKVELKFDRPPHPKSAKGAGELVHCGPSRFIKEMALDVGDAPPKETEILSPKERLASLKALLAMPKA